MKEYKKPEVINSTGDRGRAFPAIGLALIGGYAAARIATSAVNAVTNALEGNVTSVESLPVIDAVFEE